MEVKRFIVFPWAMDSEPAKRLAEILGALRVYGHKNYEPRKGDFIIDWGRSDAPSWADEAKAKGCPVLNHWTNIKKSVDKVRSFEHFGKAKVQTVPWTTDQDVAKQWLKEGEWVCCRTSTTGYDGAGLVLAKKLNQIVWAPLYTKYIPSKREFRAYVFRDKIIQVFEKLPDTGAKPDIRTDSNGWYYEWTEHHDLDKTPAIEAIKSLGLDFGGVDLVQSTEDKKLYVLETNTAPDIYKHTARQFADEIRKAAEKE